MELPKASDVGVAEYMDHYIADIVEEDEQKNLKSFMQQYVRAINPEKPIEYWVEQSFSSDWEINESWKEEINNYEKLLANGSVASISDEVAVFALLTNLKSLMIRAYRGRNWLANSILPMILFQDVRLDALI